MGHSPPYPITFRGSEGEYKVQIPALSTPGAGADKLLKSYLLNRRDRDHHINSAAVGKRKLVNEHQTDILLPLLLSFLFTKRDSHHQVLH